MTFDVGSLALCALDEFHLLLAAACIFDKFRGAHFNLMGYPKLDKRWT